MKKNITIILMLIVVIVLSIYMIKDNSNNKKKSNLEKPMVDTFLYDFRDGYDYSSGTAQLLGYVEIENRSDVSSHDIYKYVSFHVLESNSDGFMKYLKSNADGKYVKEDTIGLGCLVLDKIKFVNYSDVSGVKGSVMAISEEYLNYDELLASTKDNPVRLNIKKSISTTYYNYYPVCFSQLSYFSSP